jgi:CheY-like chemotaxis protein
MMRSLHGLQILIVEDEYLVAADIARYLSGLGAKILGPAPNVDKAFQHTDDADAAVLDVYIQGDAVFPVADRLVERGIPIVFFSGYARDVIPQRLSHICSLAKPASQNMIIDALFPGEGPREEQDDADDVVSLLPKLRLAARLLLSDEHAADRLVERALRQALIEVNDRRDDCPTEEWLNGLLERAAKSSADLLH